MSPSPLKPGLSPSRVEAYGAGMRLFLATTPNWLWANDTKRADRRLPRDEAILHPYMQVNSSRLTSWLIFDLDHANPYIWEDAGLPAPNLIVRNPVSNRSHLFYAIKPVSTGEKSRSHPIRYMKSVRDRMKTELRADAAYQGGPLAKTPHHQDWLTQDLHGEQYELGLLAEYLPDTPKGKQAVITNASSRHVMLFDHVRRFAYDHVNHFRGKIGAYETFLDALLTFAHARNQFSVPLPISSVRATARSVARWTWRSYTGAGSGSRVDRGVMGFDQMSVKPTLSTRQSMAAMRTAAIRRSRTEARIHTVCERLFKAGELAQSSRAAIAGLSAITRQGIQRYRDWVEKLKTDFARLGVAKYQQHLTAFLSQGCQLRCASGIYGEGGTAGRGAEPLPRGAAGCADRLPASRESESLEPGIGQVLTWMVDRWGGDCLSSP